MEEMKHPDELCHYGRKGMKWGQNIFGKIKAANTSRKRKKNLKKAREAKAARQKALASGRLKSNQMTDAELKAKIARLDLEKRYNDLVRDTDRATSSRGKKFLSKALDSSLDKIAENAIGDIVGQTVKTVAAKGVNEAFKKSGVFGDEDQVHTNNKKK